MTNMDFVNRPTGTASPNFARDPLMTEAESKADIDQAKREGSFVFSDGGTHPMDFDHSPEPVGDGMDGMSFGEFIQDSQDDREFPPLF